MSSEIAFSLLRAGFYGLRWLHLILFLTDQRLKTLRMDSF